MIEAHAKGISLRFKIRASAIHQIMANGRGTDSMGETCMTYCKNWILEQPEFFNRRINEFSTKATKKGNAVERDALDFIGLHLYNGAFLDPNKEFFSNNFMTGTPDTIMDDHIIDNKSSWSVASFPYFDNAPDKACWWQGQGYMHLVGRTRYRLIYTLMNTPDALIMAAARKNAYDLGYTEPTDEMLNEFGQKMTYDNVDPKLRIRIFEFDYDKEACEKIEARVELCRQFIYNTLLLMEV